MSAEADIIRDRRRLFATPGGSHDRLVAFLGKALPALIGVLLALMMITPFSPRGDVSFLLDRDQVADYARRKGWTVAEAEQWLAPNLGYEPEE